MAIRHAKILTIPDGADTVVLRSSDWNAALLAPPFVVPLVNASATWSNMPAAITEFTGSPRTRYDMANVDQVRIVVSVGVVGSANSVLRIQYSGDQSAWFDLTPNSPTLNATGVRESAWANIPVGARGDVFLRVVGQSGDGAADPQFRLVQLQVR